MKNINLIFAIVMGLTACKNEVPEHSASNELDDEISFVCEIVDEKTFITIRPNDMISRSFLENHRATDHSPRLEKHIQGIYQKSLQIIEKRYDQIPFDQMEVLGDGSDLGGRYMSFIINGKYVDVGRTFDGHEDDGSPDRWVMETYRQINSAYPQIGKWFNGACGF